MSSKLVKEAADRLVQKHQGRRQPLRKQADFSSFVDGLRQPGGISDAIKGVMKANEPWQQYARNAGIGALAGGAMGGLGSLASNQDRSVLFDTLRGATAGGLLGAGGTLVARNYPGNSSPGYRDLVELQNDLEAHDAIPSSVRNTANAVQTLEGAAGDRLVSGTAGLAGVSGLVHQGVRDSRVGRLGQLNPNEAADMVGSFLSDTGLTPEQVGGIKSRIREMTPEQFDSFVADNDMLRRAIQEGKYELPKGGKPPVSVAPSAASAANGLGADPPAVDNPRPNHGAPTPDLDNANRPGGGFSGNGTPEAPYVARVVDAPGPRASSYDDAYARLYDVMGKNTSPAGLEEFTRRNTGVGNYSVFNKGRNLTNSPINFSGGRMLPGKRRLLSPRNLTLGGALGMLLEPYAIEGIRKTLLSNTPITSREYLERMRQFIEQGGDPKFVPEIVREQLGIE